MANKQLRANLLGALHNLATGNLGASATTLLGELGYTSHKTLALSPEPQAFVQDLESLLGSTRRLQVGSASLRDRGLLEKQGAGNRTHYTLVDPEPAANEGPEQRELLLEGGKQTLEGGKRELPPLPLELKQRLTATGKRLGETELRQLIRDLCGWQALRGEELATLLGKDLKYMRNRHLSAMVQAGELVFQYPESPNHRLQAYKLPAQRPNLQLPP